MKKAKIPETNPPPAVDTRARARLEAICGRIAEGTPTSHACALERVPRSSFYKLLEEDEAARVEVDDARAQASETARQHLRTLIAEGVGTASTLLHYMARQWPQEYAETKRVEITGAEGGPQKHDVRLSIGDATDGATDGSIPGEDDQ